jgi:sulfoxide reductase heme-binding subunit YedZ
MIRRLGGRRWQQLHRLVYFTGVCGVLHYLWVVKLDTSAPLGYGALVAALLAARFWIWRGKRAATPGRPHERRADAGLRA